MLFPYRVHHPVNTTEQILPPPLPPPPLSPISHTSFPILAISLVGILVTAIFLLSYYVFVIKCCLNWHHPDVIRRLSRSQRRWRNTTNHALSAFYLSSVVPHGLDQSTIRAIPTLKFKRAEQHGSLHECAVCLNEFQDEEGVRMLPNCFHLFHIDCIDTWLQTHANCPLCRAEITNTTQMMPVAGPHVTIDVGDEENQSSRSDHVSNTNPTATSTTYSCVGKERKLQHKVLSLGDECIDLRGKDEEFMVQPIRRSFSMGSSSDRQLYMAVQERLRQSLHYREVNNGEGTSVTSNSWRIRRNFLSLGGHCRNLRNSVLPIQIDEH